MEQSKTSQLMRTPLYERHAALGAKIVPFAGWEMPVQYAGGIREHQAVRNDVGLFDVCHMGHVIVEGPDAEVFLDHLLPVDVKSKSVGRGFYAVMCHETGGTVDDVIVLKETPYRFHVVVNASNRIKDLNHLQKYAAPFDVDISARYDDNGILALQGPKAADVIRSLFPAAATLRPMEMIVGTFENEVLYISRTGYTGSGGFEFIIPLKVVGALWDQLLMAGREFGIQPIGLGARDTLRLEMGYALYGHELSDTISPIESVAAWSMQMGKGRFVGKEALVAIEPKHRYAKGVLMVDQGIPRDGYKVFYRDREVGVVTSGGYSPMLEKGIALVLIDEPLTENEQVEILIRTNKHNARVVSLPFWHKPG